MNLGAKLEAVLFARAEAMTAKELSSLLKVSVEEVGEAARELSASLAGRGIALVSASDTYELRTAPEAAPLLADMQAEDLGKGIGRAGLEVLSLVLYRGPISRTDIDYVRGVNSATALRTLLARRLVERVDGGRAPKYRATTELLAMLGIRNGEDLPGYEAMISRVRALESRDDEPGSASEA